MDVAPRSTEPHPAHPAVVTGHGGDCAAHGTLANIHSIFLHPKRNPGVVTSPSLNPDAQKYNNTVVTPA